MFSHLIRDVLCEIPGDESPEPKYKYLITTNGRTAME